VDRESTNSIDDLDLVPLTRRSDKLYAELNATWGTLPCFPLFTYWGSSVLKTTSLA